MTSNWEAKGSYVFEGSDCIAVCDTDNADTETYERRAKIMAAGPELVELVKALAFQLGALNPATWPKSRLAGQVQEAIAKATTLTIQDQTQR